MVVLKAVVVLGLRGVMIVCLREVVEHPRHSSAAAIHSGMLSLPLVLGKHAVLKCCGLVLS